MLFDNEITYRTVSCTGHVCVCKVCMYGVHLHLHLRLHLFLQLDKKEAVFGPER